MVWPAPIAACSTTRRNSSERSEYIERLARGHRRLVGRELAAGRAIGPIAEEIVGLHQLVDLARAFVDHRALAVAIEAAHRIFVGVAVGAMHLDGVAGGAFG